MAQNDKNTPAPAPAAPAPAAPTFDMDAVRKIAGEVAAQAAMAAVMATRQGQPQVLDNKGYGYQGPLCSECGQLERACNKEHVKMVVLPATALGQRYFQGIKLNGVLYSSQNSAHALTVPKVNDFAYMLQQFDKAEEAFQNGKRAMHNSGTTAAPRAVNPAQVNWQPA